MSKIQYVEFDITVPPCKLYVENLTLKITIASKWVFDSFALYYKASFYFSMLGFWRIVDLILHKVKNIMSKKIWRIVFSVISVIDALSYTPPPKKKGPGPRQDSNSRTLVVNCSHSQWLAKPWDKYNSTKHLKAIRKKISCESFRATARHFLQLSFRSLGHLALRWLKLISAAVN